jgi:hypothetical protein|tara:strand:- start:244 stop:564 length:321 start_codon:yes stop_codon:yes gene_type:complete
MAINRFFNITGSTGVTTELMAPFSGGGIKSMLLANIHASANATVTIFIEDQPTTGTSNKFNIITAVTIPTGSSLVLEAADIPNIPDKFGVYITVAASDTVDVIINK